MDLNALLYHHQIAIMRSAANDHRDCDVVARFDRRIAERLERDGASMRLAGADNA